MQVFCQRSIHKPADLALRARMQRAAAAHGERYS